jgi:hypothetical protein
VIEEQLHGISTPEGCVTFVIDGQFFLIRLDMINNINLRWAREEDFPEAK